MQCSTQRFLAIAGRPKGQQEAMHMGSQVALLAHLHHAAAVVAAGVALLPCSPAVLLPAPWD
jgi:hypothetical protein